MGTVTVFNFVTLDGYFSGPAGDISWHNHAVNSEEHAYAVEMLKRADTLLFGRITYELMASFWPTPQAIKADPLVAKGMNKADKIVFSRTLKQAAWNNTRVVSDHIADEIKRLKKMPGKNMTVLGSGSIVTQLAEQGLIDELQIMIDPIVLGDGTPMFKGIKEKLLGKLNSQASDRNLVAAVLAQIERWRGPSHIPTIDIDPVILQKLTLEKVI